ncbi:MAG: hypothetical protein ACKVRN_12420 [Pyrinomonadaceae bacterium]
MIRRSEHTFRTFAAAAGRIDLRQSWVANAIRLGLDNLDYQPKPNGMTRSRATD